METDIAIVGTGPTGLAAALALAETGASVALIGPAPSQSPASGDTRTAALLDSSVAMLEALGVWEALLPHAAALKAIRILDGSDSPLRSPELQFEASELGLAAFGYNVPNDVLVRALYRRAEATLAHLIPAAAERIDLATQHATLTLADGTKLRCRLVVGADGRNSLCRRAAGIDAASQAIDQGAIATSFAHDAPHRNVSVEIHRSGGSVTTVPLIDPLASSLIWVGPTDEIGTLMHLSEEGFAASLAARLDGALGAIGAIGPRASFPVVPLSTSRIAERRTALVGEAAHILPPIGAQGLNLGLRDAATLADCVRPALPDDDPGAPPVLEAYDRARRFDVLSRTVGVDMLNRSLLSGLIPLQAARGVISYGLAAIPALRRAVMRVGMEPPTALPSLMRRGAQPLPTPRP